MRKNKLYWLVIPLLTASLAYAQEESSEAEDNGMQQQLEADVRAVLSGKDEGMFGDEGIATLQDYISFNERIKALDLEITKMRKQMELLKIRKDILDLAQPKTDKPVNEASGAGNARLPVYRQSQDVEKLIEQKLQAQSSSAPDPIDHVKLNEVFMDGATLQARVHGHNEAFTVGVGEYLYTWRVINIDADSITLEKAGKVRKVGFGYR